MAYFERFLSRRYLFSHGGRWLVSVITFISVAGVTVGVAALIIVLGVIDGIDRDIFGKIIDVYPHLKISNADRSGIENAESVAEGLRARPEVALAEPVIQRQALFERGAGERELKMPGQVIGVGALGRGRIYSGLDVHGRNLREQSELRLDGSQAILGRLLWLRLGLAGGETIVVRTGIVARTPNGRVARARNVTSIDYFETGQWDFDEATMFVSLDAARGIFGVESGADFVQVKMRDPFGARALKAALEAELGPAFSVRTWEEENGEFFQALKLEKLGLFVVLLLVVIVASFNIIGTLILMVIEKKREIGILKAMGTSDGMVRRVFMTAGSSIGFVGTLAGLALGLVGCWVVTKISLDAGAPAGFEAYNFNRLPVIVKPLTVSIIVASSLAITLLAALFPAAQAARLDPIEALRHD